ncbi:hypothetical protein [Candidatus Phytoplasma fraxini]|uniref:Uncharacterized protein n=1 Tax=Ash yellows phytoplasma TaxID=35780 RepID=A0ABZ2UAD7_ASHYP
MRHYIIIKKNNKFIEQGIKLFIITFIFTFLTSLAFCFILLPQNHKYSLISSNTSSTINEHLSRKPKQKDIIDSSNQNKNSIKEDEIPSEEESEQEEEKLLIDNDEDLAKTKNNKSKWSKLLTKIKNKKQKQDK